MAKYESSATKIKCGLKVWVQTQDGNRVAGRVVVREAVSGVDDDHPTTGEIVHIRQSDGSKSDARQVDYADVSSGDDFGVVLKSGASVRKRDLVEYSTTETHKVVLLPDGTVVYEDDDDFMVQGSD
jgi:hypothetical protein